MRAKRLALVLALLLTALPAAAAPAAAAITHEPTFGGVESGGGLPFEGPCGVALDASGNLYVSDYHHGEVDLFGPGSPFGKLKSDTDTNSPCGLAVDSAGALYANYLHQGVFEYVPTEFPFLGPPLYTAAVSVDPARSTGVAVDPASDRLYVAHRTYVAAYETDGSPVLDGSEPLRIGLGAIGDGYGVAVSGFAATQGHVYVADAADGTVKAFDPSGDPQAPVLTIDAAASPQGGFSDLTDSNLAVDPGSGHVFVLDNLQPGFEAPEAALDEFASDGEYLGQITHWLEGGSDSWIVHGLPSGLAIGSDGSIYVSSADELFFNFASQRWEGGHVYAFGAAPVPAQRLEVQRSGSGEGAVTSKPGGIACGTRAQCALEYRRGTTVTLTAEPRPHSAFAGWSVDGSALPCPGSGACVVTLAADTEVTAEFSAVPRQRLTVGTEGSGTVTSLPAGIVCGQSCAASYDRGTAVALSAEPALGWRFAGWSGAGCDGTGACQATLSTDLRVSARFEPLPSAGPPAGRALNVLAASLSGSGSGSVESDPAGFDCGAACARAYAPGTRVTLVARADTGSRFAGWSGCDSIAGNRCTVVLADSRTVGASFEEAAPLALSRVTVKRAKAVLKVAVPAAGSLVASGRKLRPAKLRTRGPGTVALTLSLGRSGRKALAAKGRLRVPVRVAFTPADGGAASALSRTVTFKRNGRRRG